MVSDDVALLHRRLGFGVTADRVAADAAGGFEATAERLVASVTGPAPQADLAVRPPLTSAADALDAKKANDTGVKKVLRTEVEKLVRWWLQRMATTEAPAQERLLWFWHGHFATSVSKVKVPALVANQLDAERRLSAAPFPELALAAVRSPAMLLWLDQAHSTRQKPNENLGRELLELFTLGRGDGYGEPDVVGAARALTGWTLEPRTGAFAFRPALHDPGPITLLGRTGPLAGEDVVAMAAAHPATARNLAWRAWTAFAGPVERTDPVVADVAAAWDRGGRRGDALLAAVVAHPRFRQPATFDALVRSPVEWAVVALRALGLDLSDDAVALAAARSLKAMGQVPFSPPSVGGWPRGRAWLTTGAEASRLQLAGVLAGRADLAWLDALAPAARPLALAGRLGRTSFTDRTTAALSRVATDPVQVATLALVSPEACLA